MAIGFDIVIPDKLITKLAEADRRLKTISQTSEETKNRVVRAFNQMTIGADEFLKKLQQINTEIGKLGNVKLQITTTNTTQSVDDINKLIQLTEKLTAAQKKQFDATARAELVKKAKSDARETTKRQISEEQKLTAQIKAQNAELSAEYKRKSKENISIADNEARKRIAASRLATKEIIAQMQRETRFRIQEANRIAKLTQTPTTITRKDVGRIIDVSRNATSINQMQTAIKNLEKAKRDLDTTDKKYDKTVKAINNEIARQQANLRKLGTEMDRVRQNTERARGITEQLRRSLMLMFSLSQISGYIKKLVAVRGEFELQKRSLEAILQNKDAANEIWDKTVQLAIKSPFQIKELVSYTKQLAAYRVESDKLHNTTKMLADVSAGLGVDMQRLILAYGQVKAANYLRGTELRQFSEAGINILGELATYFSEVENRAISVGEVFQMVSKRMVSFADVEEVFKRITSEGGTFYNMQEIQAETLKGQISNLRDSLDVMLNDIGMSQEGVLKGAVRMARNLLNSWEEWGTWVIPVLTSFLAKWALVNIISKRNSAAITRVFVAFTDGFNKVGASWTRFNAYVTIAAAVAAAIWAIVNAIRAANKEARELNKIELTGIFEASKMDAEYKRLANIVSDVTKSYDEQKKALDALKRTYDDILPKHLLEAKTIKEMAGNYDEATAAINNYMNAQIKQKQISYIDEDYTNKIIKESDNLTSELFNILKDRISGLKRTDVATVINEFSRQLINGQIAIGEYEVKLQELFDNSFGEGVVKVSDFYKQITLGSAGLGPAQTETVNILGNLTTAAERYLEKMNEIVNYKPRIGSGIVTELNNIKESYKQSAMDIEKYKKVISDKAKGSELVTDEQYQDAINNLNAIFEYTGKEAPNWAEIINEPFKLNQATIEANQSLWKKMIDDFKDKLLIEHPFKNWVTPDIELAEGISESVQKAVDDATKDVEKFAGSEFQQEVNRIAIYVQDKMNKSFVGLQGLLPKETESRDEYAKRLEEKIKEMEAGIAQQKIDKKKGGDLMDDELAKQYEEQLPLLKEFYSYFYHKDKKDKSKSIFEERLRILREMYDSYRELNNKLDETKAKEGVWAKYGDAFREAFNINLNTIDYRINTEKLSGIGSESGEIFSENMKKRIEEVIENGTYIRKSSDIFKDILKQDEGVRYELYDDATGNIIKDAEEFKKKVGTATIGIGHAVFSLEEATKYFGKTLTNTEVLDIFDKDVAKHEIALNNVLDKYKNIILTQEQYDALLNKTYQGGAKSVEYAIEYATNIEKGLGYFERLGENLKGIGKDFDSTFGADFIDKFKNAETVTERLALVLQTTNLYTKGKLDPNLIKGMISRAKEVAEQFSGDIQISKSIEKSSDPIFSSDFFINDDTYIEVLDKMLDLTQDAKDRLKIGLEKGRVEWDIIIDAKIANDEKIKDQAEKLFSDYESMLELNKLGISGDAAYSLFGIESMDLDKVRTELEGMKDKFIGLDMEKEYKKYQDKLTEMEVKAQQERLKKYLQYTRDAISERAKLELQGAKNLAEIEKTWAQAKKDIEEKYAISDKDSADEIARKTEEKTNALLALESSKPQAIEGVRKEMQGALQELDWKEFSSSDTFVSIFNDLENTSTQALTSMIDQLEKYKSEWTDLPIDQMEAIAKQLEKMKNARDVNEAVANPFKSGAFADGRLKAEDISKAQQDMISADESILASNQQISNAEYLLQLLNEEKNLKDQSVVKGLELAKLGINYTQTKKEQKEILEKVIKDEQKNVNTQKQNKKNAQGTLDLAEKQKAVLEAQSKYLGEGLQMANDLYDAFSGLYEALGGDKDNPVAIFADMGMNMANTVIQTIQLQIQLQIAAQSATGLGAAMNTAMGVIGWVVMAVQLLTQALSAIAKAHDNKLQKQIERDAEAVELLQKRYEKLEEAIDNAMSFGEYQQAFDENKRNLEEQIRLTEDMIALEEDKKKTDEDAIKGYKDNIEEYNEQLQEMEEKRISDMGGFGSQEAIKDAAMDFVDAWAEAYNETGDGLDALRGKWDEYFDNLLKKQMMMKVANKYLEGALKEIDKALEDDVLTGEEMENLERVKEESSTQLNNIMKQLAEQMGWEGGTGGSSSELDGLSESIQGVTEVTAQALEAILNSMRFYVIDNNKQLVEIANTLLSWESPTSPILAELKAQTGYLSSIDSLFNSVIDRSGSPAVRIR